MVGANDGGAGRAGPPLRLSWSGQRLGLVGLTVGVGSVGVTVGVSWGWGWALLPLLTSITTTPPLMVRPFGLVSAAVPAGQVESTVLPTETSKPAPSRRSFASGIESQETSGMERWSPYAILSLSGVLNWTLGLPSMKSASVFQTAGFTIWCDI